MHHLRRLACILAGAVLPALAGSAEVYRWIDAQGTPHVADRPPPNPPANMTRETLPDPASLPRQPTQAQGRTLAPGGERSRDAPPRSATPASAPAAPQDCRARWESYQRSQACFAPYRTADAGMKPEAFAVCGPDLPDPSPDCGPLR